MPAAHPDNGGIEVYSRTPGNTAEVIEAALKERGYGEFESETYSTGPATAVVDPPAEPVADPAKPPVDPAASTPIEPAKPSKPGRAERLAKKLAASNEVIEQLREDGRKRDLEMAEFRGRLNGLGTPPAATPPAAIATPTVAAPAPIEIPKFDKPRPKLDDFLEKDDPQTAYEDAVAEFVVDKRDFERTERQKATERQQEQQREQDKQATLNSEWNTAVTAAKSKHADFDAVMSKEHFDAEKKPLPIKSAAMDWVVKARETGPEILYWLGTHPKEANEMALKTLIKDPNDPREVEKAMRVVRAEFDRIEQELSTAAPAEPVKPGEAPPVETPDEDDEFEDDEERETDPNLPIVASDPASGRQVPQEPKPGAVDTTPPASQATAAPVVPVVPKSEPVSRVGSRASNTNRPLQALPKEAVKDLTPDEYRRRRALEGSSVARG